MIFNEIDENKTGLISKIDFARFLLNNPKVMMTFEITANQKDFKKVLNNFLIIYLKLFNG